MRSATMPMEFCMESVPGKGATPPISAIMAILAVTVAGCTSGESAALPVGGLPRYALQPGMELHYSGQGSFKHDRGSFDSASDWKVWVTRENSDGSWRIVIRYASVRDSKDATSADADVTLAYLDLFPDGRFAENSSFGYRFDPHVLFARLPANEKEVRSGWQSRIEISDATYRYTAKVSDMAPSAIWQFLREDDSPRRRIYRLTSQSTFSFDRGKGLVLRVDTQSKQESRNGGGIDHIELKDSAVREPAWIAALERDMDRYFQVNEQHSRLVERLHTAVEDADDRLRRAADLWTKLHDEVTTDVVRDAVQRRIAADQSWRAHRLVEAERLAGVLGQPAPDWKVIDLAGNHHRLADYQGKILVLDFWYRGCGWCVRAMPQVNQIADEFAAAPVVVLGMNTDSKLEDAKFVENEMRLKYPSLRIDDELPKRYGVRGFPTLVILDQEGVIRDIYVGYTPTLRASVAESIRLLLENPASRPESPQGNPAPLH